MIFNHTSKCQFVVLHFRDYYPLLFFFIRTILNHNFAEFNICPNHFDLKWTLCFEASRNLNDDDIRKFTEIVTMNMKVVIIMMNDEMWKWWWTEWNTRIEWNPVQKSGILSWNDSSVYYSRTTENIATIHDFRKSKLFIVHKLTDMVLKGY